ncbi:MAG TPA: protein-disulfide reductase DsbD domain-containing protein [Pyrinomonadaceae bacterium]|jgi:hypothetical protein
MRRKILLATVLLLAPLALGACGGQAGDGGAQLATPTPAAPAQAPAAPTPPAQVVTAKAEETRLDAGGAVEASVRLDIAPGYHVQANPAADKFYVATELSAQAQEGVTPGRPVYPPGLQRKLGFAEKPLSIYEGSPVIKLPLSADKSAAKGAHTFRARVRVQPCNDQTCLNPRDLDVTIPLTVN